MLLAAMIDSREPQSIQALRFGGVPTVVTALECGDLWATTSDGALLVIERKTVGDLLGSVQDKRLFLQAAAMRERSVWAYVVITGALEHTLDGRMMVDGRVSNWRFDDVQGALLTVQELGVAVVVCQGAAQYEETVLRLAKRERGEVKVLEPREPRLTARVLTPGEQVLMALPGIGIERSQTLLAECSTAAQALAWLSQHTSPWREIAGIGEGMKAHVRRALGLADDEWLMVVNGERSAYAAQILLPGAGAEDTGTGAGAGANEEGAAGKTGAKGQHGQRSTALPLVGVRA